MPDPEHPRRARLCAALIALMPTGAAAEAPDIAALIAAPDPAPQTCDARAALWPETGRIAHPYAAPENPAYRASSARELRRALRWAGDGDVIALADGVYDVGRIRVTRAVTLRGETRWGATLTGASLLELHGDGITIAGLAFRLGAETRDGGKLSESLRLYGDDIRIIDNDFSHIGAGATRPGGGGVAVSLWDGDALLLENNRFSAMRGMALGSTDASRGVTIRHNDFLDSPSWGGFGEIAQIGNAWSTGQATTPEPDDLRAVIRANYVCNWTQESELISLKGNANIVEGNVVERSGSSAIVVRMGNENMIRDNVMLDNRGQPVRISGERNRVTGNLFSGSGRLGYLHVETGYEAGYRAGYGGRLERAYWAAKDNVFTGNTYVGYDRPFHVQTPEDSRGALGDIWDGGAPLSLPHGNSFDDNTIYTADPAAFARSLLEFDRQTVTSGDNRILPLGDLPPRPLQDEGMQP